MRKPLPYSQILRHYCVLLLLCSLCLPIFSQTIYVSTAGSDGSGDGSIGNPYRTITHSIAMAAAGNTIELASGTYDELVVIDKSVTIDGINSNLVTATFTGVISNTNYTSAGTVLPTVFKVTAQNVTIRNIKFVVNLNLVHSAIHTSGNASGLQVLNNEIRASANGGYPSVQAGLALVYARTNAIAINPSINYGASKYTLVSTGLSNIKIAGNFVTGTTAAMNGVMDANFRAAVYADYVGNIEVGGTVAEKNILQTINHDVILRFIMGGPITIRNNEFNGGGVELSSTNDGTGTMLVESNYFNYLPPVVPNFPLVRLMNNIANKQTIFKDNNFYNHNWYINLANYNNVLIDNNTFTPVIRDAAANNDFRLITVNTKVLQSSAIPKVHNTARFVSNQFFGVAGADGTGIAFYNHDAPATMGLYVVGEPGKENVFNADITRFYYIDNNNGQATTSLTGPYPEYSGIFNTTTAYWTQNILASQNYYDIGAGSLLQPLLMDGAQRATLASMVTDQLDDANTAMVVLYSSTLALQPRNTIRPGDPEWGTFDIYPNPVTAGLNVQVYTRKKQSLQLRVFNMSGVCLKTLQAASNTNVNVNMAGLPAGVYAIELVTPEGSTVRQMLKR